MEFRRSLGLALCNTPVFTKLCVPGGEAYLNNSKNCEVAVTRETWTRVKLLFD